METKNLEIIKETYEIVEKIQNKIKENNNNKYNLYVAETLNSDDKLYFELSKEHISLYAHYYDNTFNEYHNFWYEKEKVFKGKYDFNEYVFKCNFFNSLKELNKEVEEDNARIKRNHEELLNDLKELNQELSFNKQICLLNL